MLTCRICANNSPSAQHMSGDPWGLVAATQLLGLREHQLRKGAGGYL